MLSRLLSTIREQVLFVPGERVLVAVSGGPDSTALLHALVKLAPRLGITVEAATIDHGLRPEAAAECTEVARRCGELEIVCAVQKVDVHAARARHVSWQDAARRARLAALEAIAQRRGCDRIALGHTADDQAETVLFRLVRGTGLRGLSGIPYRRGPFIRPMLDVRRSEVLRYLARRRLTFVDDPTNADRRFARSRVRHDWLPFLERENPKLVEALLALASEARGLPHVDRPMARRPAAVVARLAASGHGTRQISVHGGTVEVSYGQVKLRRGRDGGVGAPPRLELDQVTSPPADGVAFDSDRLAHPLRVRLPRPGDRMRPRGGRGSRKLSDLLIDAKVPRPLRRALPVLEAADGTILFVPGLRPADAGRPVGDTKHWLRVRVLPANFR